MVFKGCEAKMTKMTFNRVSKSIFSLLILLTWSVSYFLSSLKVIFLFSELCHFWSRGAVYYTSDILCIKHVQLQNLAAGAIKGSLFLARYRVNNKKKYTRTSRVPWYGIADMNNNIVSDIWYSRNTIRSHRFCVIWLYRISFNGETGAQTIRDRYASLENFRRYFFFDVDPDIATEASRIQ